ncbi:DUF2142 domain-containing protein [Aestuariivirga sp.]|uniref:DUF2142 domain-containing protein n=1 Tax=Aestuariivirga sp. TaxID=2650926 RepID=UPI003BA9B14A
MMDKQTAVVSAILLTAWIVLSIIIPPFQSPDEDDHIARAYFLSKGMVFLHQETSRSSGGMNDTGLLALMEEFRNMPPLNPLTRAKMKAVDSLQWTGIRTYDEAPGTGYYFPAIYVPQAAALFIGEKLDLPVVASIRLARLAALATTFLLISLAFSIYPASPLIVSLLFIPMNLFQGATSGIDGIAAGLTIFSAAAFSRLVSEKGIAPSWIFPALAAATIVLTTSRLQATPQFILLLYACIHSGRKTDYAGFGLSFLLFVSWTIAAARYTVDLRNAQPSQPFEILQYYSQHPQLLAEVLWATLSDKETISFYLAGFLGILGYMDTALPTVAYVLLSLYLLSVSILSVAPRSAGTDSTSRNLLILASVISPLIVLVSLLITWTEHPAKIIQGVQGRYFEIAAIYFAYGISGGRKDFDTPMWRAGWAIAVVGGLISIAFTSQALLYRYYILPFK